MYVQCRERGRARELERQRERESERERERVRESLLLTLAWRVQGEALTIAASLDLNPKAKAPAGLCRASAAVLNGAAPATRCAGVALLESRAAQHTLLRMLDQGLDKEAQKGSSSIWVGSLSRRKQFLKLPSSR